MARVRCPECGLTRPLGRAAIRDGDIVCRGKTSCAERKAKKAAKAAKKKSRAGE